MHLEVVKRTSSKLCLCYHNSSNWTKDLNRYFSKEAGNSVGKKVSDCASVKSIAQGYFFITLKILLLLCFPLRVFVKQITECKCKSFLSQPSLLEAGSLLRCQAATKAHCWLSGNPPSYFSPQTLIKHLLCVM